MKDNKNKLKMVLLIGAFFLCGVCSPTLRPDTASLSKAANASRFNLAISPIGTKESSSKVMEKSVSL